MPLQYDRWALQKQPTLSIADLTGKPIAVAHAWANRADLMAIELPNDRRNFADADHGLGNLTAPGEWFGLKIEVDTKAQTVNVSVRRGRGRGRWVPLNKRPLPYYDTEAKGTNWCLGLGTYKQQTVENNSLEIDNIRVEQMPVAP